ncbi:hypothetical protein V6N13_099405 [Hibiscus sabdariffa]
MTGGAPVQGERPGSPAKSLGLSLPNHPPRDFLPEPHEQRIPSNLELTVSEYIAAERNNLHHFVVAEAFAQQSNYQAPLRHVAVQVPMHIVETQIHPTSTLPER